MGDGFDEHNFGPYWEQERDTVSENDGEGDGEGKEMDSEEFMPSSEDSEVNLDELDFISDEELVQCRRKLRDMGKFFDVIDNHDGFDIDVDEQKGSDYSVSDGDLDESDSENDAVNPTKGKIVFDPRCNYKTLELVLGMYFKDGFQCKQALTTWTIENGRYIHFKYVTKEKLIAHYDQPCIWYVFGSVVRNNGTFMLKTYRGDHTCARAMYNKLLSSRWIANRYLNAFRVKYNMSMKDLRADILNRYKTHVKRDRLYKARSIAQELVRGSVEAHYASIRDYIAELRMVDNEGRFELLLGENSVFKGLFIGLSALRKAFKSSCRPVIGLDGCHVKTYLKGILLCAIGKDGNNGMFPIAWAIVEIENEACWPWFLKCLLEDLQIGNGEDWTFISDQQKGLENAISLLAPQAEHRNCARHVYMNFKKAGHKGVGLQNLFWKAVNCTYKQDFKLAVQEMKEESVAAYEDFMSRGYTRFCKAFISTVPCSDSVDNNMSETFNSYIVNARNKHVIHMLEEIRTSLMVRQVEKFKEMSRVSDTICPKIRKILEDRRCNIVDCIALPALGDNFEVECYGDKFVVCIENNTCTCRVWELTGVPCIHAISAIQYLGRDPVMYVNDYFSMRRFMCGYKFGIQPIKGSKMWPHIEGPTVKPPYVRRMAGRPKKMRIRAPEERENGKMSRHGTRMTCTKCGQQGHNKRGCQNEPVQRPLAERRSRARPRKQVQPSTENAARSSSEVREMRRTSLSSRTTARTNTFRERAIARQGVGLYTASSGNAYYHASTAQRRVLHVHRGAHSRGSSSRQPQNDPAIPTTQESWCEDVQQRPEGTHH